MISLPNPYLNGFGSTNGRAGSGFHSPTDYPPFGPEMNLAVPHVLSFNAIIGTAWRTYYHGRYDEALKHSQENADAMRNDPFIRRIVQERKLGVQSLGWRIEVDN